MEKHILLSFGFRLISKDNEKIQNRKGRYFLSKKYKNFEATIKNTASMHIFNTKFKPFSKDDKLHMTINAYFTNRVHSDMWNLPKSLSDALQNTVYPNDRQIKSGTISIQEDANQDYFTVYIEKVA